MSGGLAIFMSLNILKIKSDSSYGGFTLIEIMVAVSIFVIVALIATGAFITANRVNQKAQAIKLVVDNLNFAIDSMVIKIRRGDQLRCYNNVESALNFSSGESCLTGAPMISFVSKPGPTEYGNRFAYRLNGNKLQYCSFTDGSGTCDFQDITTGDVVIDHMSFKVFSVGSSAVGNPLVAVSLSAHTTVGGSLTKFALQTAASVR